MCERVSLLLAMLLLASSPGNARTSDLPVSVDYQEMTQHRLSPRPYIRSGNDPTKAIHLRVVINPQGEVESADSVDGAEPLRKQAELLEKAQHFKPFLRDGRPIQILATDFVWLALREDWISPRVPFPEIKDRQSLHIKLVRWGTLRDASYSVELLGNGTVIFSGQPLWGILIAGHHSDSVPQQSIDHLITKLRENDFFSLKSSYSCAYNSEPPSYTTSIEFDNTKKEVVDRGDPLCGKPEALTIAEELIDKTTGSAKWLTGTADTVPSLLREHWDFQANTCDNDLLFLAATRKPEILRLYLEQGLPPIKAPGKNCFSPLVSAAASADSSLLMRLIGNRKRLPATLAGKSLVGAALAGQPANIRLLIAHGASPDSEEDGTTALEFALLSRKAEAVDEILKHNPDIKRSDRAGHGVISFLMDHGVPPSAQEELIPILIKAGADVNARGGFSHDKPIFLLAQNKNCPALLKLLVAAGASVNARDQDGYSPLMQMGNNVDCAKALIAQGADLAARNRKRQTALDVARDLNNNDVAQLISAAMRQNPRQF